MNIIDIGSNSVRLLSGQKKTVITTRLAENMTDGVLNQQSISRTVQAIKTLRDKAQGKCYAFATEAVRKAVNKEQFLREVYEETGLIVDVLSGEQEAEVSYLGATYGLSGSAVVIDLGGASCEIIFGKDGKIAYKRSFAFGCVNMTDRFNHDYSAITQYVSLLLSDLPSFSADNFIAVGGTATSFAAMAQALEVYDPNKVHGYNLNYDTILKLIEEVTLGKQFPTLSDMRAKTIAQGGAALNAVMRALNQTQITVSEKDNLEGYLLRLL